MVTLGVGWGDGETGRRGDGETVMVTLGVGLDSAGLDSAGAVICERSDVADLT